MENKKHFLNTAKAEATEQAVYNLISMKTAN